MFKGIGTIIDAITILVAGGLGLALGERINKSQREALTNALGLLAITSGVLMIVRTTEFMVLLISVIGGVVVGERLELEARLRRVMKSLEARTKRANGFSQAFMLASLLSLIGPLAIVGPIEEGLGRGIELLMYKTGLDGVSTVLLTSVMGAGVILSVVPVVVFQGGLTLLASQLGGLITESMINGLVSLGGVMIMAVGLDLLKIKEIKVVNMLPGFFVVPVVTLLLSLIGGI